MLHYVCVIRCPTSNQLVAMLRLQLKEFWKRAKRKLKNENGLLSGKLVYVRLNFSKIAAMILPGKDVCFAFELSFRKLSISENRKRRDNE